MRHLPRYPLRSLRSVALWVLLCSILFCPHGRAGDGCADCHRRLQGPLAEAVSLFESSVHAQAGLNCSSCHRGDPSATRAGEAMNRQKAFVGRPNSARIPGLCGACHSSAEYMKPFNLSLRIDQVSEYKTSVHGQRSAHGDPGTATCTSCHSVHDIRRINDPLAPVSRLRIADTCGKCHSNATLMRRYKLPSDQVKKYKTSMHATALYSGKSSESPTCNNCHGNHGTSHLTSATIMNLCGSCHLEQRKLFEGSSHQKVFATARLKGCIVCHDHHASDSPDKSLTHGTSEICLPCHRADRGTKIAEQWGVKFRNLKQRIEMSRRFLIDAERVGINIKDPSASLARASLSMERVRQEIHSLDDRRLTAMIEEGQKNAEAAYGSGMRQFEGLQQRNFRLHISLALIGMVSLLGSIWLARSIVERHRDAEALRLERERIMLSRERLARIGEISAGVAHTIRNPLHGLMNCVDILKSKTGENDSNRHILDLMTEGLERMRSVTQRLLVLTREAPPRRMPTDLGALVEDVLRFVEVRCQKKRVGIRKEMDSRLSLEIDPNQFSEALLNVLDNAIDASEPGGMIILRVFVDPANNQPASVEIKDTGCGIPPQDLPRIFDPFFTSKPIGEGTGLGLAIARRIIEEHGGRILVESQLGLGTHVFIHLPASISASAPNQ